MPLGVNYAFGVGVVHNNKSICQADWWCIGEAQNSDHDRFCNQGRCDQLTDLACVCLVGVINIKCTSSVTPRLIHKGFI